MISSFCVKWEIMIRSKELTYVGMVMVWRTKQYKKAKSDIATREVGRTTLVS
jgi:hypothetical protein